MIKFTKKDLEADLRVNKRIKKINPREIITEASTVITLDQEKKVKEEEEAASEVPTEEEVVTEVATKTETMLLMMMASKS